MAPARYAWPSVAPTQLNDWPQSTMDDKSPIELKGIELSGMELRGIELSGMELRGLLAKLMELSGMELNGDAPRLMELRGIELRGMELNGTPARASERRVTLVESPLMPKSAQLELSVDSSAHQASMAAWPSSAPPSPMELSGVEPSSMELSGLELRGDEARFKAPKSTELRLAAPVAFASTSANVTDSSGEPA